MRGRRLRLASEAHSGNQTLAPAPVSFSIVSERIGVTTLDMITQLTSWTHHEDGGGQG